MAEHLRLKELAASLGLSVPAVSLALRNAGNISVKTCLRVQKAAAAMGYKPNPYAAALSTGWQVKDAHEMPLAILSWPSKEGILYPTQMMVDGILERGAQLGYRIDRCNLSSVSELPRCTRLLYNRGIQGVFVAPVGSELELIKLDWGRFCVLACGRYNHQTSFHTVRSEIFENTRAVISLAAERGYRRIGAALYHHNPPMIDDFARLSAIRSALTSPDQPTLADAVLLSKPGDDSSIAEWVRQKRLDAVIVFAVGQYYRLMEQGIRVPEDVGVATLHHEPDLYNRHISGVFQQNFEIGIAAANHMDFMIRHHDRGVPPVPQHIVIGSKWVEGTTLPDRRTTLPPPRKKPARKAVVVVA